jgi:hypothetical protein
MNSQKGFKKSLLVLVVLALGGSTTVQGTKMWAELVLEEINGEG